MSATRLYNGKPFKRVAYWLGPKSPLGSMVAGSLVAVLYCGTLVLLVPWLFKFFGWYFDWVRTL